MLYANIDNNHQKNLNRFTIRVRFDLHSTDYFYSGAFRFEAFTAGPGAHARFQCTVLGMIVFMETWYASKTLLANSAFHVEGLVQVQSWVFGVDVCLYLCIGRHRYGTRSTRILTFPFRGQISHASRVCRFRFLFALL